MMVGTDIVRALGCLIQRSGKADHHFNSIQGGRLGQFRDRIDSVNKKRPDVAVLDLEEQVSKFAVVPLALARRLYNVQSRTIIPQQVIDIVDQNLRVKFVRAAHDKTSATSAQQTLSQIISIWVV